MLVTVHNRGPEAASLHVLPQLWFRNTWSWRENAQRPQMRVRARTARSPRGSSVLGDYRLYADGAPALLFTDNDSNLERLYGVEGMAGHFKDAFHEHLIHGAPEAVNPGAASAPRPPRTTALELAGRRLSRAPAATARRGDGGRRSRTSTAIFAAAPRRGRRVLRRPAGRDRRSGRAQRPAPGLRRHDLVASSSSTTTCRAGWTATRPSRRRPRAAGTAATATGATSTTTTSSRCRTNGSIPGTPPGTSPSTASRSRWSTPSSPSSSSCC